MSEQAQRGPLNRYQRFHTGDLDEARNLVAGIFCPHELSIAARGTHVLDTCMSHVPLGGVSVNRLRYGPTVNVNPGCLERFYLVMMPLTGRSDVFCGRQQLCSSSSLAAVVSPTEPMRQTIETGTDQIMIQIDRELIESTCAQLIGQTLSQPLCFRADLDMRRQENGWSAMVAYLLAELDQRPDCLASAETQGLIASRIATTLLCSLEHTYSDTFRQPPRRIAPSHVKRVRDYIDANAAAPLTVAHLAAYAGVSASTLHAGFREYMDSSPMAYLREVRLRRVHEALLTASPASATVTDIALRWGFHHLGHFTSYYKKRFNKLPCDTLRKS